MSRLDPAESKSNRINQRKNYLGDRVMIVALSEEDFFAEKSLQFDAPKKEMQKIYAAEMGDILPGERYFEIFGSEGHRNVT